MNENIKFCIAFDKDKCKAKLIKFVFIIFVLLFNFRFYILLKLKLAASERCSEGRNMQIGRNAVSVPHHLRQHVCPNTGP